MIDRLSRRGPRALRRGARGCSTAPAIDYELDPRLVRGLDYYTRTVFEFRSDALGAQSGIGGGGRYDRLIEQIGGDADARAPAGRPASSGSRRRCEARAAGRGRAARAAAAARSSCSP